MTETCHMKMFMEDKSCNSMATMIHVPSSERILKT